MRMIFRKLGNYKGDILDAQKKLNEVNGAIPQLNEKAKLILALNNYMPKIEKALNFALMTCQRSSLKLIKDLTLRVKVLIKLMDS